MIKYIFLCLIIFQLGCSQKGLECPDMREAFRQSAVIDCHLGILATTKAFNSLLKGKVTKKQVEELWASCGTI